MLSAAPESQAEMFRLSIDFDDAIEMFEDRDDPEAAAMEHVQETLRSARQREKEAFIIFMAMELWTVMGLSCESAFIQLFQRAKKTLYRWKKELGFTDWHRSAVISTARRLDSGGYSPKCHRDTSGNAPDASGFGTGGAQMSFQFMAPIAAEVRRLRADVIRLRAEHYDHLDEETRAAVARELRDWCESIVREWEAE